MHFHWKILLFAFLICFNLSNGDSVENPSTNAPASITRNIASLGKKLLTAMESESKPNENLLISPANIFHALALLHMAAGGKTLTEVSNFIGIPASNQESKSSFQSAVSDFYKKIMTDESRPATVSIADALFLQNGFKIKQDYQDAAIKSYQAQIENINFVAGAEAVKKVNQWVSQKTRGRISKIVESFSPYTQAVILSTLYFKANWAHAFKKDKTINEKFSIGEKQVDVQMMQMTKRLPYIDNPELQFQSVDLPYTASDYSLNIILPYANQTVKELMPKLKNVNINEVMGKSKYTGLELKLPKTKFNVAKSLIETFQHLGVQELFTDANLTALTDTKLKISQILHSAEIEIHEEGTVASAATSIGFILKSGNVPPKNPIPFFVNRPFIINIYDTKTGLILFSGIVYQP